MSRAVARAICRAVWQEESVAAQGRAAFQRALAELEHRQKGCSR